MLTKCFRDFSKMQHFPENYWKKRKWPKKSRTGKRANEIECPEKGKGKAPDLKSRASSSVVWCLRRPPHERELSSRSRRALKSAAHEELHRPLCTARSAKLWRARSRLHRSQILQVNMRLKALVEIYTMHSFAQLQNHIFFKKLVEFAKLCKN